MPLYILIRQLFILGSSSLQYLVLIISNNDEIAYGIGDAIANC